MFSLSLHLPGGDGGGSEGEAGWVGALRMRKESSKGTTSNCIGKKPAFGFVECIDFLVSISLISALIFLNTFFCLLWVSFTLFYSGFLR